MGGIGAHSCALNPDAPKQLTKGGGWIPGRRGGSRSKAASGEKVIKTGRRAWSLGGAGRQDGKVGRRMTQD